MHKHRQRSASTPRLRTVKPLPASKKGPAESRPGWDDTTMDMSKYKLTPRQMERKKDLYVSKNRLVISAEKRKSVHDTSAASPSPSGGGGIDYSAVVQMLGYGSSAVSHASQANQHSPQPPLSGRSQLHGSGDSGSAREQQQQQQQPEMTLAPGVSLAGLVAEAKKLEQRQQAAYDTALDTFQSRSRQRDQTSNQPSRQAHISTTSTPSKSNPWHGDAPKGSAADGQGGLPGSSHNSGMSSPLQDVSTWGHWEDHVGQQDVWRRNIHSEETGAGAEGGGMGLTSSSREREEPPAYAAQGPRASASQQPPASGENPPASGEQPRTHAAQEPQTHALHSQQVPSASPPPLTAGSDAMSGHVTMLLAKAAHMEARLYEMETHGLPATGSAVQQQAGAGQGGGRMAVELGELRGAVRELREDNAAMRQELSALSRHSSSMMTALQAQLAALLRQQEGDGGHGYPLHMQQHGGGHQQQQQHQHKFKVTTVQQQQAQDHSIIGRSIFSDLPNDSGASPYAATAMGPNIGGMLSFTQAAPRKVAEPPYSKEAWSAPIGAPVTNVEDDLDALPSYSAFRRSAVTGAPTSAMASFTAAPTARQPAAATDFTARPTQQVHRDMGAPSPRFVAQAFTQCVELGGPYASGNAATDPLSEAAATQLPGRSLPSQYVGRSIGGSSILAQSHIRDLSDTPLPMSSTLARPSGGLGAYSSQPMIFSRGVGSGGNVFGGPPAAPSAEYGVTRHKDAVNSMSLAAHSAVAVRVQAKRQVSGK